MDHMIVEEQLKPGTTSDTEGAQPKNAGNAWRGLLVILLLGALALACIIYVGVTSRARANTALERETMANSIPAVAVTQPKIADGVEEVVLPGNMQAFIDTPIWARASGYLKTWNVDLGARVKKGELLAEIESPEVNQQLEQARAQLNTDEANLKLAQITAERYNGLGCQTGCR
jgi:multidrug efflux pump subunit AcrA (membrane-fusion protein)